MRNRRLGRVAVALATSVLLAGCGATGAPRATPTTPPATGARLTTLVAPTCPVQRPGETCSAPISVAVTFTGANGVAMPAHTDASGTADVPLPPGEYTVTGAPSASGDGFPRTPAPVEITIRLGAYTAVQLVYDTGLR